MTPESIQSRLDKQAETQAKKDFAEACRQAANLLRPFFEPLKYTDLRTANEVEEVRQAFSASTRITNYYDVLVASDMPVPKAYVRRKQVEASKAFIEKVEALQYQLDELYGGVES